MALVNPQIAMSVRPTVEYQPRNALVDYAQMQQILGAQEQQQLNALKMQEARAALDERTALRRLDPNAADYGAQLLRINPTLGMAYRKDLAAAAASKAAQNKSEIETAAARQNMLGQAYRDISQRPSDANITAHMEDVLASSIFSDGEKNLVRSRAQELLAMSYNQRVAFLASQGAKASELKPNVVAQTTGGTNRFLSMPAFGGEATVVPGSIATLTVSPDAALSASTATRGQDIGAQTAAAGQQVTIRGQDIGAATATRGQDIGAATATRGQDIGAATATRGQDIGAATATRGQDIGAATATRGQDIGAQTAAAGQQVTMRGQDIGAQTATRGQDIGAQTARAGQQVTMRGQDISAATAQAQLLLAQQRLAWERANPGFELREGADGMVYGVNKQTLQAFPVNIGGGAVPAPNPVAPGAAAPGAAANAARTAGAPAAVPAAPGAAAPGTPLRGKGTALTETQSNAVAFGMRMVDADAIIKKLESSGVTSGGRTRGFVEGTLTSLVPYQGERLAEGAGAVMNALPGVLGGPSPEQQQYAQAKLNFITAILRKESGAAISPAEFANEDKKYFPQAGEGPAVVEQKRRARGLAIRAMRVQAGPGGRDIGGGADDPLGLRYQDSK